MKFSASIVETMRNSVRQRSLFANKKEPNHNTSNYRKTGVNGCECESLNGLL